jgi:hypothetical protein
VAAPLGNIDKLVMLDSGSPDGANPLSRLANAVPTTMFHLLQAAQAVGIDLSGLLSKIGIKSEEEKEKKA